MLPEALQQDFLHHYYTILEEAAKASEEIICRFYSISIGEADAGALNGMWVNLWLVRLEMGYLRSLDYHKFMCKQYINFK